jgi:MazG family protein
MQESSALGRIVDLVRDLRRRCPWDGAQTPQTLRPYLVEEVFELDHALGLDDPQGIRVELGDVLLHVAFQIVLAEERGQFGPEELTRQVEEKMWRRHPHLFPTEGQSGSDGAPRAAGVTAEQVKANWEKVKLRERDEETAPSVLDGLPPAMPALVMAFRLQERAAGVGFDWPDWHGPLEKVREETVELTQELDEGADRARLEHEIGDLLFAAVNLARKAGLDPRAALESANHRFADRFRAVERLAADSGLDIHTAGLETLDRLWDEAKRAEQKRQREQRGRDE